MQLKRSSQWLVCALGVTAFACGGRPTIEEVKTHFENPTGSTGDKTALISATGKQEASETAQRVAGNGNAFGGLGLTAVGKKQGLDRLQAGSLFARQLNQLKAFTEGKRELALNGNMGDTDACVDEDEVNSAFTELFFSSALNNGKSASADFSYTIDLNECTKGEVTGTMAVDGEIELTENSFRFLIEEELTDVCETVGQKACVDGEFAIEMATTGNTEQEEIRSLSFTTAWFVTAAWDEDGSRMSAEAKGGMRINADDTMAKLEVLMFVVDKDGTEVSLVLRVTVNADGSGTVEIRGTDGSLSCVINADGSGECVELVNGAAVMGESKISWTEIEAKEVTASDEFGAY